METVVLVQYFVAWLFLAHQDGIEVDPSSRNSCDKLPVLLINLIRFLIFWTSDNTTLSVCHAVILLFYSECRFLLSYDIQTSTNAKIKNVWLQITTVKFYSKILLQNLKNSALWSYLLHWWSPNDLLVRLLPERMLISEFTRPQLLQLMYAPSNNPRYVFSVSLSTTPYPLPP